MRVWVVCLFVCFVVGEELAAQNKLSEKVKECMREEDCHHKFWVYFEDKGLHHYSTDQLTIYKDHIKDQIHPKALQRRTKQSRGQFTLDEKDFPVFPSYITQILSESTQLSKTSKWLNAISVTIKDLAELSKISQFSFVKKIDLVHRYQRSLSIPNIKNNAEKEMKSETFAQYDGDLHYGESYEQLEVIQVPDLHLLGLSGQGITVLILDSGFNLDHPSIRDLDIQAQHDFVSDDDDVADQNSDEIEGTEPEQHGTATLSTLGGKDDGQHYGPAYGATFLLAKTESVLIEDPVEEDYFISGVEWGEALGADVLSASLGYQFDTYNDKDGTSLIDRTIDIAVEERGIVAVVAVGNEHRQNLGPGLPGDSIRALSIGATYLNGDITYFSSQGPTFDGRYKPDLCAPGYSIHVANWNFIADDEYIRMSGTSFSCPLVAGVVALLLESHPDWRPNDVHSALMTTADQAEEPDNVYGFGVINATAANNYIVPNNTFHENGVCDDFERCSCDTGYYGPYCKIPRVPCETYCVGGYCDDGDCHCDTRWEGKLCIGECEARENGCIDCLQHQCAYCAETQTCLSRGYHENCPNSYSETYCASIIQANADNHTNIDGYFVVAVVILCFAVLLVASAAAFFFCIIRP